MVEEFKELGYAVIEEGETVTMASPYSLDDYIVVYPSGEVEYNSFSSRG